MLSNQVEKLDPRARRTRQMLLEAFEGLLSEQAFSEISVNNIATRAGVNRATFYAHYADKYALLERYMHAAFQKEVEQRMLSGCRYSLDNLRLLIVTVCEFVARTHTSCATSEAQFTSLVEAQIRSQVYSLLLAWLEEMEGFGACGVTRQRVAIAASWAIYGLAYEWERSSKRQPPAEQYAAEVLPLITVNLGQPVPESQ